MTLETERLFLRPWTETDAEDLYSFAKDPQVGPMAGWPVHTSVENSREIINGVLSAKETYAVILKESGKAIGSIGLNFSGNSSLDFPNTDAEIGYWIGVPYWGNGYIPEATRELMRRCFMDLGFERLWCGYYEGNDKSKRVQEKVGFRYHHKTENVYVPLLDTYRTEYFSSITKEEWLALPENRTK